MADSTASTWPRRSPSARSAAVATSRCRSRGPIRGLSAPTRLTNVSRWARASMMEAATSARIGVVVAARRRRSTGLPPPSSNGVACVERRVEVERRERPPGSEPIEDQPHDRGGRARADREHDAPGDAGLLEPEERQLAEHAAGHEARRSRRGEALEHPRIGGEGLDVVRGRLIGGRALGHREEERLGQRVADDARLQRLDLRVGHDEPVDPAEGEDTEAVRPQVGRRQHTAR